MGKVHIDLSVDNGVKEEIDTLRKLGRIPNLSAFVSRIVHQEYLTVSKKARDLERIKTAQEYNDKLALLNALDAQDARSTKKTNEILEVYRERARSGIPKPYQKAWIESRWSDILEILPDSSMSLEDAYSFLESSISKLEV